MGCMVVDSGRVMRSKPFIARQLGGSCGDTRGGRNLSELGRRSNKLRGFKPPAIRADSAPNTPTEMPYNAYYGLDGDPAGSHGVSSNVKG